MSNLVQEFSNHSQSFREINDFQLKDFDIHKSLEYNAEYNYAFP